MRFGRSAVARFIAAFSIITMACEARAITIGELDTFSADLEDWRQGLPPNGMLGATRATTGGPAGAGDAFMRVESSGGFGPQSKIVVFNTAQWAGDYLTTGVSAVFMSVNNLGSTDLNLRLALGTDPNGYASGGSWFVSTSGIPLSAGSGWTNVLFPLGPGDLEHVFGPDDYGTVMGNVLTFKLLHSSAPNNRGDAIEATLGVDNVWAIGLPGDYNGDGHVGPGDYTSWRNSLGATGPGLPADGTGPGGIPDMVIDDLDYDFWKGLYGTPGAGSGGDGGTLAQVPEPTTLWLSAALFAWGGLLFASRRREPLLARPAVSSH